MAWLVFVLMTLTLPLHPLLSHVWCISLVNQSRTDRLSIIEGYYWSELSSNSLTAGLRRRRLCLPLWILPSSLERWSLWHFHANNRLILLRKQKENKLDVFCDGKWNGNGSYYWMGSWAQILDGPWGDYGLDMYGPKSG